LHPLLVFLIGGADADAAAGSMTPTATLAVMIA
jgi:hypothetical protein